MKKYYVCYYRDFGNTYNLVYTDSSMNIQLPDTYERITRDEALRLCAAENQRRKDDYSSAYLAASTIMPADYNGDDDIMNDRRYHLVNRIWEKKNG